MGYLNLFALSKAERNKRLCFRCIHRHNGITHSPCYDKANGLIEKVGFFDIESSNLTSDYGLVLCYAIKHEGGLISNSITPQEIKGSQDKRLLTDLCKDLRKFTRIITWYGTWFDVPFCRSRAIYHKLDFPVWKEVYHTDAYLIAKKKLATIHSKKLKIVAEFYGIPAKKHAINPQVWLKCLSGSQKALDFIQIHCEEDVETLRRVWQRMEPYTQLTRTSI